MPRPYLARLMLWGAVVLAVALLVGQWLALGPDAGGAPPVRPAGAMPPPPPAELAATDTLAFASRTANRWLGYLAQNWIFLGQLALIFALGWGAFARGLGAFDLIYADSRRVRFVNGLIIGLMFGDMLFVQYLANEGNIPWPVAESPGLFPVATGAEPAGEALALRRAGNSLLVTWLPVLAAFYLPGARLARRSAPDCGEARAPALGLGLMAAPLLASVLVLVAWAYAETVGLPPQWRAWYGQTPGARAGVIDPGDFPLHLLGAAGLLVPLAGLSLFGLLAFLGRVACPVWVIAMLIWLANAVYGLILFHFTGLQYVLIFLAALLAYVANARHSYKLSLPNLKPETEAARYRTIDFAHLGTPPSYARKAPLIKGEELLEAFRDRFQRKHDTNALPKLVVVATSGGGIRAAVWTAAILEGLEARIGPRFAESVRLIAGASGGMVGAGLYAANRVRLVAPSAGESLAHVLAKDSLWPLMQTFLTRDLPSLFLPFHRDWDRGYSLERTWHRNAPASARGELSPWRLTFAQLREAELGGLTPSLIYSPLLVEDGRRLLISNLDLRGLASEHLPTLSLGEDGHLTHSREQASVSAVEFFRLFPDAHTRFELCTAARLNATFPFVSPNVCLPADPPRRVVDAGYLDNYGSGVVAAWLGRNRAALRKYCSGVCVLELRAFPLELEKNAFDGERVTARPQRPGLRSRLSQTMHSLSLTASLRTSPPRPSERAEAGNSLVSVLAGVSTPAEALLSVRSAGAYYRNDMALGALERDLNTPGEEPFLVRAALECPGEAALSWAISARDRDFILRQVAGIDGDDPANLRGAALGLAAWLRK